MTGSENTYRDNPNYIARILDLDDESVKPFPTPVMQLRESLPTYKSVDPYTEAFYQSLANKLDSDPLISSMFATVMDFRKDLATFDMADLAMKSIQAIELANDPNFALGKNTPDAWDSAWDKVADPASPAHDQFTGYLYTMRNRANIPERAWMLKLIGMGHGKGIDSPATVFEPGCSQQNIIKKLIMQQNGDTSFLPFMSSSVMRYAERANSRNDAPEMPRIPSIIDEHRTKILNRIKNSQGNFVLGNSVGMDLEPPTNESIRRFSRSASVYTGELAADPDALKDFDTLANFSTPEAGFFYGDIAQMDHEQFEARFPDNNKFDISFLSFFLYQMASSPDQIASTFDSVIRRTKLDGVIVVMDAIKSMPESIDDIDQMKFHEAGRPPFGINVWAVPMQDLEGGFRKYAIADSGRLHRISIEKGIKTMPLAKELGLAS